MQTLYEIHIEYSQNGRVISDEIHGLAAYLDEKAEYSARDAAWALLRKMDCGSAAVYWKTCNGRSYRYTEMHFPFKEKGFAVAHLKQPTGFKPEDLESLRVLYQTYKRECEEHHRKMLCPRCGSLLSAVTFTCVRGEHCREA